MYQGEEGRKAYEEASSNKSCGMCGKWGHDADPCAGVAIVTLPHIVRSPASEASDKAPPQPDRSSITMRITLKDGHVDRLKGNDLEFVNSDDFVIITSGSDGDKPNKCIAFYAKSEVVSVVRVA